MKITEQGVGSINLNKNAFVASGGEGSIYAVGKTAYKIYLDPKKMIPLAKMQELGAITDNKVIRPLNPLLNSSNKHVGYSMRYIKNTSALCQLFTKSFKDRNNIDPDIILNLVRDMQKTIQHIHDKGILIVDLNELNFLVDKKFKEVYFIDVDSYQTQNYPATAIMESIRDRHNRTFSKGTDWFSFGVVSFQMFIGIHPYKGKYQKDKKMSMNDRMLKNLSVFNSEVNIPKMCPPLDIIPEVYKDWYLKVFEEGYRGQPPFDLNAKIEIIHTVKKVMGDNIFQIKEIGILKEEITYFWTDCRNSVTKTVDGFIKANNISFPSSSQESHVSYTPKFSYPIESYIGNDQKIYHRNLSREPKCTNMDSYVRSIMSYNGRTYGLSEGNVLEFSFVELKDKILPNVKIVGTVMPQASQMYDGVVIQNMLGRFYASVFPQESTCYQISLMEAAGHTIVDAKFDTKILMIIVNDRKGYTKHIYSLDNNYKIISERKEENLQIVDLNFVYLEKGIVAHINDKENLELFRPDKPEIKEIESKIISSDMKLTKRGNEVCFIKGKCLYSLKMK